MIIPLGRLPSERYSPGSSNTDGMLALVRDCSMMVFYWSWRGVLYALRWQLKSCSPVSSTHPSQWVQSWGSHTWAPNQRLVAKQIVALHICSPREQIGEVVSHVPDSFWLQSCNWTLSLGLAACWLSKQEKQLSTTNKSLVFCLVVATLVTGVDRLVHPFSHLIRAWAWMDGREGVIPVGRMACEMGALPAAEAN